MTIIILFFYLRHSRNFVCFSLGYLFPTGCRAQVYMHFQSCISVFTCGHIHYIMFWPYFNFHSPSSGYRVTGRTCILSPIWMSSDQVSRTHTPYAGEYWVIDACRAFQPQYQQKLQNTASQSSRLYTGLCMVRASSPRVLLLVQFQLALQVASSITKCL